MRAPTVSETPIDRAILHSGPVFGYETGLSVVTRSLYCPAFPFR